MKSFRQSSDYIRYVSRNLTRYIYQLSYFDVRTFICGLIIQQINGQIYLTTIRCYFLKSQKHYLNTLRQLTCIFILKKSKNKQITRMYIYNVLSL